MQPTNTSRLLTREVKVALLAVLVISGVGWIVGHLLAPLAIAMLFAVLLLPMDQYWRANGGGAKLSAAMLTLLACVFLLAVVGLIVPLVASQISGVIELLDSRPQVLIDGLARLLPFDLDAAEIWSMLTPDGAALGEAASRVIGFGSAALDSVVLAILFPVTLFFLLFQGRELAARTISLAPADMRDDFAAYLGELRQALFGYMQGQGLVCLSQAIWHATGFVLLGLDFAILLGVLVGFSALVPVIGNLVMLVVTLLLASVQFDGWWQLLAILALFGAAQLLETFVLSPWLVGDRISVHPLLVILSVLVGGKIGGFAGALLALPAITVLRVTAVNAAAIWRRTPLYTQQ